MNLNTWHISKLKRTFKINCQRSYFYPQGPQIKTQQIWKNTSDQLGKAVCKCFKDFTRSANVWEKKKLAVECLKNSFSQDTKIKLVWKSLLQGSIFPPLKISVFILFFLKVGHALIIQQWFNLGKGHIYPCRVDPGVCVSVCSEDTASWAGHSVTLACYCIGSTHTLAFSSVGI